MPTYQYRCTDCSSQLEAVQKFTDPSLTECPQCSGSLRKVFNAVGVVFKGSGFYRTDSRTADKKRKAASTEKSAATPKAEKSGASAAKSETSAAGTGSGAAATSSAGSTTKSSGSPAKAGAAA